MFTLKNLGEGDLARLQAFYESNPLYFETVNGAPPSTDAARETWRARPPEGWSYQGTWLLGFEDDRGAMAAMASGMSGLFFPDVWHLGLFIVATHRHRSTDAATIYRQLEAWMREQGAEWIRLGVVVGNTRAERFWERMGYQDLKLRQDVEMGSRVHDLRVMAKPLAGGRIEHYLERVVRDRPDT